MQRHHGDRDRGARAAGQQGELVRRPPETSDVVHGVSPLERGPPPRAGGPRVARSVPAGGWGRSLPGRLQRFI
ncbi:hypothetical protein SHKM778_30820 [Streptomyces sp. KM77-8]|uniref:Uncharacterized protein n=1 Tax=Streptomyces haneummycinicus TaxID=3074435 RepID=A0AAT9HH47_9ACTN